MIRKNWSVLIAVVVLTMATYAAEQENPFKAAKVGDWVEYKISSGHMNGTMKQTVIKKTDTEVTLEIVNNMGGQEMKQQQVIKLNEKYDPLKQSMPKDVEMKIVDSGEENLTVADKTYSTKWTAVEVTMKVAGQTIMTNAKTWISSEVPLGGMVKTQTEMAGNTMTIELIGSGSAK
ncbi:MAG: hypothetical protein V1899_02040 [Planctomycetota bacterium]